MTQKTIIISASSDIGFALTNFWLHKQHEIIGTYRTKSKKLNSLQELGLKLVYCDLSSPDMSKSIAQLQDLSADWDNLILCPGVQDPVGPFLATNFDSWRESININFISQMNIIHSLLPFRRQDASRSSAVLLFAGGGTNSATVNYSSYTLSKIALVKACELLDAEVTDTRFTILGPGWVKTKIHQSTIDAGPALAGSNYQKTLDKLSSNECNPMSRVVDCCQWALNQPRAIIGGRNISVVFDSWGSPELDNELSSHPEMYKLRRSGNSFDPSS
ncbi:SDR family oxidoreductase [Cyanobium sp. WAJ14-Wanaka]|uniref:SDR family NAD(P)-dependent oxidoreductase n=1 Tax=Cyanobium sp. WAJ14-Wanaka TaxID=2823725 RepID=UPI0020CCBFEA|nr:SDR family NAD(P)-dependent oxidoreductase [Cyanobium sp. WAJ14-Wanaka]MCP9775670.1 SDR family NAD(P)-dependent oxidoreductase [Cyanobium sp. WAJ14-Wanaka]